MTKRVECLPEERLGEVLSLPESDPRQAHLAECPRCGALRASYQAFLEASQDPVYGASERAALDVARRRLLDEPERPPASVSRRTARRDWMAWLAPVPRPALAVATIVAALVVSALAVTRPWQPRPSVIRGTPRIELALDAPRYDSDGGVRLSWRGSPGSESYVVRFFSVGLEPIGEVPAGPESALNLSPSQLPQTFSRGESVLYRVVALRGGDELATSAAGTIRKP